MSQRLRSIADACSYRSGLIESPIWYDLAFAALALALGRTPRRIVITVTHYPAGAGNGHPSTVTFGARP